MAKLLGGTDPVFSEIGKVTQGLGFELLEVDDSPTGGTVTVNVEDVLVGDDFTEQLIPDDETPIQVTFGDAQATPLVDLDALGNVTFLAEDDYQVRIHFAFGRDGGGQAQVLWGRVLLNGVQLGVSVVSEIDDAEDVNIDVIFRNINVEVGDILTCEIYKDGGSAVSGVKPHVSGIGWNPSPSMEIHIFRAVAIATV